MRYPPRENAPLEVPAPLHEERLEGVSMGVDLDRCAPNLRRRTVLYGGDPFQVTTVVQWRHENCGDPL